MEVEIRGLVLVVRDFAAMVNLLGVSGFIEAAYEWGVIIGEVKILTFQGEDQMSGHNWLCLAMALMKALF
jgi:hypothetical protein